MKIANKQLEIQGVTVRFVKVEQADFKVGDFPKAEKYYQETISLPMFSKMTEAQQDKVVHVLGKILQG